MKDPNGFEELASMPVDRLATLAEWLIPPSRKQEVEDFKARETRRRIRERDLLARKAKGTKPGETIKDPRGYYGQRGKRMREIENRLRASTATNRQPSTQDIADQKRLRELRSLLADRLQKLVEEEETFKAQLLVAEDRQEEIPTAGSQGQAYLNGFGWLSTTQLGDLILSDKFEQLEERCRKDIVDTYLALVEAGFESKWKDFQDDGLSQQSGEL